jgi:RimJ/RimL family protein N-acetyltransferase
MAAFRPRDREAHTAHWHAIRHDHNVIAKRILYKGEVAGNIVSGEQDGHREVGFWIRKPYWGKGIATRALSDFLAHEWRRPLFAYVAQHNGGSLRVLAKSGFVLCGRDHEHLILQLTD